MNLVNNGLCLFSRVANNYVGEDSFRYDANGDISIEDAEKERTL